VRRTKEESKSLRRKTIPDSEIQPKGAESDGASGKVCQKGEEQELEETTKQENEEEEIEIT
jgi:hypothetical protein